MRKKIDSRVRTLVENGIKTRHRSIVVLVGDKGRDQVTLSPLSYPAAR
jgi:N-acetyltransferase 10